MSTSLESTSSVVADSDVDARTSSLSPTASRHALSTMPSTVEPTLRPKAPARTYGKRVPEVSNGNVDVPADASVLARQSSVLIVPESEDVGETMPPSSQNRKDLPSHLGDLEEDEREDGEVTMRARGREGDASSEGSDDDDDDNDLPKDSIFARKSVAEMLKEQEELERAEDEREEAEERARRAAKVTTDVVEAVSTNTPAPGTPTTMSTLTPLTTSDDHASSGDASAPAVPSSSRSPDGVNRSGPATGSDAEDSGEEARTTRKTIKARRAIIDSEDEEDEEPRRVVKPIAKVDRNRSASPERAASKKERLEAMAMRKKLKSQPIAAKEEVMEAVAAVSDVESIEDDSDSATTGKAKGKKAIRKSTKGQSKKDEEAMNRETAALQRNVQVHVEPRTKYGFSVDDIVRRSRKDHVAPPTFKPGKAAQPISSFSTVYQGITAPTPQPSSSRLPPSSASVIDTSTSSPHIRQDTSVTSPEIVSIRHKVDPPLSRLRLPSVAPASRVPTYDDDDDDLPELATLQKKFAEKKQREKDQEALQARKRAAAEAASAARSTNTADSDSDDLEIVKPGPTASTSKGSTNRLASPTPKAFLAQASKTPRLTKTARKIHDLAGPASVHAHEHDDDTTQSQLVRAGRSFGQGLGPGQRELLASKSTNVRGVSAIGTSSIKTKPPAPVTTEAMDQSLLARAGHQAFANREKKRLKFRRETAEKAIARRNEELASVDVAGVLQAKEARLKEAQEKGVDLDGDDEDVLDADWVGSEEEGETRRSQEDDAYETGDDVGSSSELEGADNEVASSEAESGMNEDDDEDSLMPPPPPVNPCRRALARIEDDEDEDGSPEGGATETSRSPSAPCDTAAAAAPQRMMLFGAGAADDDEGFTQLFGFGDGDGISQMPEGDGGAAAAPLPTFAPRLVDDTELEQDADEIEAYGAEQTPRPAPRGALRYLNKHGMLTQTRPTSFSLGSPAESNPSVERSHSFSTTGQRSQISQTQIEPGTPSQAPRDGRRLVRADALIPYDAVVPSATREQTQFDVPATEPASMTETQPPVTADEDDSQAPNFPSAQPPPRNAFEALKSGALAAAQAPPLAPVAHKRKPVNDFIDDDAELSEEETGFGGGDGSGDEDETGMDAELEELVDHSVVDEELAAEQDMRAQAHHAAELAKADAENEALMKRVAEGKERLKRKNGGLDLSDDEFDDDGYGMTKNRDKTVKRAKNQTMEELEANEETQAFAQPLKDGMSVGFKEGALDFLAVPQGRDGDDSEEEEDGYDSRGEREGDLEDDEDSIPDRGPRRPAKRAFDIVAEEEEIVFESKRSRRDVSLPPITASPRLYNGISSSPDGYNPSRVKFVSVRPKAAAVQIDTEESQGSLTARYASSEFVWKSDAKGGDSMGGGGKPVGKSSSVTYVKPKAPPPKEGSGSSKGRPLARKQSSMGYRKKDAFA